MIPEDVHSHPRRRRDALEVLMDGVHKRRTGDMLHDEHAGGGEIRLRNHNL